MGKAERTRQFIIEKAAPIFNQKGVAGTSISDILKATRLAKGGVYGNFASKEEIVMEVFDYIAEEERQQLTKITATANTSRGKFEALFEYYATFPKNQKVAGGCPMLNFGVEADDTNPGLKKKVSELVLYYESRIAKMVQYGKDNGEFEQDWDEKKFAVRMFTMLEGAILVSSVLGNNKQMLVILEALREEMNRHTL
jgi:TetR/AcrR family transcriptional repressor of nem operon